MTNPKKTNPNPIEEAIGDRARPQTSDEPSPSEMLTLEELNRQTEERLQDQYPEENLTQEEQRVLTSQRVPTIPLPTIHPTITTEKGTLIPVSKPVPPPATKTSSPESPPQKNDGEMPVTAHNSPRNWDEPETPPQDKDADLKKALTIIHETVKKSPAEDVEFTALKKYILEDGFVLSTVAFHIVSLCAEPLTTPSTTTWDFVDRAFIPDMVLALLNQPGYLEGIWPSLKIVMGSNAGNAAWTAGISTTIAFFDVIRTLPAIKELKNETEKKS